MAPETTSATNSSVEPHVARTPIDGKSSRWPPRAVLAIAALALGVKLALALTTVGTNDVAAWIKFAWAIRVHGAADLYARDPDFNHPPFMVHVLEMLGWLADRHWLPFEFWLRLPAILADCASLVVVHRIFMQRADGPVPSFDLGLLAVAPISIFISGFHGNTDPVMVMFLLLTVLWIDRPGCIWLAGVAFGMSMNIKVVPLVFAPAVFLYLPSARSRLVFVASALGVVLVASMPVLFQVPVAIVQHVLGYGSQFGIWGLSRIATELPRDLGFAYALQGYGIVFLLVILLTLSIWMNRGGAKPSLYRQFGLIAFTFLTFSPGFGVQYLAWLVPWIVGVRRKAALFFQAANGVFLFCVYTYWSHGFPWSFANSEVMAPWGASIIPLELVAWASVAVLFVVLLRAAAAEKRPNLAEVILQPHEARGARTSATAAEDEGEWIGDDYPSITPHGASRPKTSDRARASGRGARPNPR